MNYLIGIDIGTSATKTVLFDENGTVIASASREYPLYQPENGWAEQRPQDWREAAIDTIGRVIRQAGISGNEVRGVGLSGQMHGLVMLWVRKRLDLKHFITIPVMYLLGILPAWIAGRPFMELIGIYAFQGSKDRWSLSIKFPNIYQIIGNNYFLDEYVGAGMYLILGILMMVMFYMAYRKVRVTKEMVILMVVFFGILTTYFIPHMHERYLYVTDAFLLIYVLIRVKRFPWFVASAFIGVMGYAEYLSKNPPAISYGVLAWAQLALLVRIGLDLYHYLHNPEYVLPADAEEERGIL